jgi:hypothetical protein
LDFEISPLESTTVDGRNDFQLSCGGNGNEAIFRITVKPEQLFAIRQNKNSFDSQHELSIGPVCPGEQVVECRDDPVTLNNHCTKYFRIHTKIRLKLPCWSSLCLLLEFKSLYPSGKVFLA